MENPATWNEVQKAISEAIDEHKESVQKKICGLSLVSTIYYKLREKGFLSEKAEKISKK